MSGCPREPGPDAARFARALAGAASARPGGIGTLREKPLHLVLKRYCEPDESRHEVRVGRYVADIFDGRRVTEIQTRNLAAIRPKLAALLESYPVTLVCPVVRRCTICRVDGKTGAVLSRRKSPKIGSPASVFSELIRLQPLLAHPRLTVRVVLVDAWELRPQARPGRRSRTRGERMPCALVDDITLPDAADYARLMPAGLPERFTSRDFSAACRGLRLRGAQDALRVLASLGVVARCGKAGRLMLYRRTRP